MFRDWILAKIINGERASYSAPKFARMQERTRSQMLEDLVANLQNHAETGQVSSHWSTPQYSALIGQIPKPYRRGSWRPIGHMRPSSPLLDSVRDQFEGQDQMARDFSKAFVRTHAEMNTLFDVTFVVGDKVDKGNLENLNVENRFKSVEHFQACKSKKKLYGVRAILGVRSRVFQEMLYGITTVFGSPQVMMMVIMMMMMVMMIMMMMMMM